VSSSRQTPEADRIIAKSLQRIDELERRLANAERVRIPTKEWSLPGAVYLSTSGPWKPTGAVKVSVFRALLTTPGTSTTTVRLRRNGAVVATLNMGSGINDAEIPLSIDYARPDRLDFEISSAGLGAAMLTVIVEFR